MKLLHYEDHRLLNALANETLNPYQTVFQEDHHYLQSHLIDTILLGIQFLLSDDRLLDDLLNTLSLFHLERFYTENLFKYDMKFLY